MQLSRPEKDNLAQTLVLTCDSKTRAHHSNTLLNQIIDLFMYLWHREISKYITSIDGILHMYVTYVVRKKMRSYI